MICRQRARKGGMKVKGKYGKTIEKSKRLIAILVTLILVIPLLITGTFAWQSISQQALNETGGREDITFDVELLKLEKSPSGDLTEIVVSGATFYLFTADGQQIGGRYETDNEGRISVSLPAGEYYFEETDPGISHTFDEEEGQIKTRYPFTVTGSETAVVQVKAYNPVLTGSLTVEKTIVNFDGSEVTEEQEKEEFIFTVTFSDEGTYSYRIDGGELQSLESGGTLILKHGQKAVFENIPVGVTYSVIENTNGIYQVTSQGSSGTVTEEGAMASFINTLSPGPSGSLIVTKEVRNADGSEVTEEQEQQEFTFKVTFSDDGTYTYQIDDGEEQSLESGGTVTLRHGQELVFTDIPSGIGYTVEEMDDENDEYYPLTDEIQGNIMDTGSRADFVNVYMSEQEEPGSLFITKEIVNPDEREVTEEQRQKEFTFRVTFSEDGEYTYRIDEGEEQSLKSGETITLRHGQKAAFEEIPEGITYRVQETATGGYIPEMDSAQGVITAGEETQLDFRNHAPEDKGIGRIEVAKAIAGEYPQEDLNMEFGFTITIDGKKTDFTLKPGEVAGFEAPVGSSYEVVEDNHFEDGYSQTITGGSGTVDSDKAPVTVTATNTYVENPDMTIGGEKTWNLKGQDVELPESIIVRLKDGSYTVEEKEVAPDDEGRWTYSFTVPKYDTDGNEISYTVEEESIEGFTATYEGFDIINTWTGDDTPGSGDGPAICQKFRKIQMTRLKIHLQPAGTEQRRETKAASVFGWHSWDSASPG